MSEQNGKRGPGRHRKADQAEEPTFTHEEKLEKEHENHLMKQPGEEHDRYPEGTLGAEPPVKPSETTVEHPRAPTDEDVARDAQKDFVSVVTKEGDASGPVERTEAQEDVEIEGTCDHPSGVHVGDGRSIKKGDRMKVSKEAAKALVDAKHAKRVH